MNHHVSIVMAHNYFEIHETSMRMTHYDKCLDVPEGSLAMAHEIPQGSIGMAYICLEVLQTGMDIIHIYLEVPQGNKGIAHIYA